ncbi:hypothetical protein EDC55_11416 [Allofrancisella inopinata]|uniref:Uncharacterized protein n=1 Tax=Allofrancisella inopinata TaxID=1085647 RepID=A0AAE7CQ66_9GAMM|nr:hypothetical protein [Allofrancisella inopinata]QIV95387.1 hypothetical protein E4K63_00455 [Allofrancisella inopinata]TDT70396.1 hypothetical protein EDC55_11416 [Allofrancisella inopinata]
MSDIFISFNGDLKPTISVNTSTHTFPFINKGMNVKDNVFVSEFKIQNHSSASFTGPFIKFNPIGGMEEKNKELLINQLRKIEINEKSRIYLEAHGSLEDDFLTQRILAINSQQTAYYAHNRISAKDITEVLFKSTQVRSGLGIYVVACHSVRFASELIKELDNAGFRKIYTVGFCSKTIIDSNNISTIQNNDLTFNIEYSECDGSYNKFDNKIAYFNEHFEGLIESVPYEIYKKHYLKNQHFLPREGDVLLKLLLEFKLNIIDVLSKVDKIDINHVKMISKLTVSGDDEFFNSLISIFNQLILNKFYQGLILNCFKDLTTVLNPQQKGNFLLLKNIAYSTNDKYIVSYLEQMIFTQVD